MEIGQGITMVSERAINPHKFHWFLIGSSIEAEPKNCWAPNRHFTVLNRHLTRIS